MKTLKILNNNGYILHKAKASSIRSLVENAVSDGVNLESAVLRDEDLSSLNLKNARLNFADLKGADLSNTDFRYSNLRGTYFEKSKLTGTDFEFAILQDADLRGTNLEGADLRGTNLEGADLRGTINIPQRWINFCSRDMLYVFSRLTWELAGLKEALQAGRIDGTCYYGKCACLIGTLSNLNGTIEEVCTNIAYYDEGLHNYCEQWFYQIRMGDKPKDNPFAKHAVKLINQVLKEEKKKSKTL